MLVGVSDANLRHTIFSYRFEWFRNDSLIRPSSVPGHDVRRTPDGASELVIVTVSGQSYNRYQCKARNEAGTGFSNETVLQEACTYFN